VDAQRAVVRIDRQALCVVSMFGRCCLACSGTLAIMGMVVLYCATQANWNLYGVALCLLNSGAQGAKEGQGAEMWRPPRAQWQCTLCFAMG
jgi:hypothetical protein